MRHLKYFIVIIIFIIPVLGQFHNSITTDNWIYNSVERLQIAGYFRSLQQGSQPYTRQQIAKALINIADNDLKYPVGLELARLRDEFEEELEVLEEKNKTNSKINLGTNLIADNNYQNELENDNTLRIGTFLNFGNNLAVKYSVLGNDRLAKEENYIGDEWRGITGYQEQMYVAYSNPLFNLKFGRDYVKWGYGKKGQLLISDNSRSFDMLSLKTKVNRINFQSLIIKLNNMEGARRYLSAVRFEFNPWANLFLGISQAGLFGGQNQVFDMALANPFSFSYFTVHNDPEKGCNAMVYFDLAYYLNKKYKIYGELLIDDYQADSGTKKTLEPNEIGFTVGAEFLSSGIISHGWFEFTQIRNRTYNTPAAKYEKFVHRNKPIGYSAGTDLQRFNIHLDKWMSSRTNILFEQDILRKGEGTILGEFTTPYLADDITVEKGYSEKIPYGIVETTSRSSMGCKYFFNPAINLEGKIGYEYIKNVKNNKNTTQSGIFFQLQLWFSGNLYI
jgi:hypothetical protein